MTDFDFNYDEDTAIDPDDMLEEWLKLSSTFYNYAKAIARIEKEVQQVWEVKKTIKAELVAEAKTHGAKNDADREAYYRPHPEYMKAVQDLIDIQYQRDLITAARDSFYRKERGLEGAATILLKVEYWGKAAREDFEIEGGKRIVDIVRHAERSQSEKQRRSRRTRG